MQMFLSSSGHIEPIGYTELVGHTEPVEVQPKKFKIMASLQPNCTLWKKKDETKLKNVCTVELPAGKTLVLRQGDPSTTGNTTLIRYNVVPDSGQKTIYRETKSKEFPWDGQYHVVNTHVISGPLTYSTSEDTDNAIQY